MRLRDIEKYVKRALAGPGETQAKIDIMGDVLVNDGNTGPITPEVADRPTLVVAQIAVAADAAAEGASAVLTIDPEGDNIQIDEGRAIASGTSTLTITLVGVVPAGQDYDIGNTVEGTPVLTVQSLLETPH